MSFFFFSAFVTMHFLLYVSFAMSAQCLRDEGADDISVDVISEKGGKAEFLQIKIVELGNEKGMFLWSFRYFIRYCLRSSFFS